MVAFARRRNLLHQSGQFTTAPDFVGIQDEPLFKHPHSDLLRDLPPPHPFKCRYDLLGGSQDMQQVAKMLIDLNHILNPREWMRLTPLMVYQYSSLDERKYPITDAVFSNGFAELYDRRLIMRSIKQGLPSIYFTVDCIRTLTA